MTAKISRLPHVREAAAADATPQNMLSDLGRQQLAVATESACALFRGSQAIRQIQQQTAHQALERHQSAAQKLRGSREPLDLMAIQTELMRFDLDGATQYWQQLASAAMKTQVEMMTCAAQMLGPRSDGGFKSLMDSWQATLAGTLKGPAKWPAQSQ